MLCLNESLWSKCWLHSVIGYRKIKLSVFTAVPCKPHFCLPSGTQSLLRLTGHFYYRLNDWINPVLRSWYLWLWGKSVATPPAQHATCNPLRLPSCTVQYQNRSNVMQRGVRDIVFFHSLHSSSCPDQVLTLYQNCNSIRFTRLKRFGCVTSTQVAVNAAGSKQRRGASAFLTNSTSSDHFQTCRLQPRGVFL